MAQTPSLTLTIGGASARKLIPVADDVLCKCTDIKPNQFNPDSQLDFGFTIIDFDYEDDDEDTEAEIQQLAQDQFIHWERCNLVFNDEGELSKNSKLYKQIKGMRGGKELEEGEQVNLAAFQGQNFRISFDHQDKKGGPPDFAIQYDNSGAPIQKAVIARIRPEKRRKRDEEAVASAPARKKEPVQAQLAEEDSDLYPEDDVEE